MIIDDTFSVNHSSSVLNLRLHSCCDGYATSRPFSSFPDTAHPHLSLQEPSAPFHSWENRTKPTQQRAGDQLAGDQLQGWYGHRSEDAAAVPYVN